MYVGSQYPWLPSTPQLCLCHATLCSLHHIHKGCFQLLQYILFFIHATFTSLHSVSFMSQQKRLSPFLILHPIPHFLYDCLPFLPSTKAGLTHPHVKGRRRYLCGSVGEVPQASQDCESSHSSTHHHPLPLNAPSSYHFKRNARRDFVDKTHYFQLLWTELCPPQLHMLKSESQCDGIWRWELWEIIRFIKKGRDTRTPLCYMDTEQTAWFSDSQEKSLHQHLDLGLLASRMWEVSFWGWSPPDLWCFVTAACARTPTTLRRSGLMRNITTTGEKSPETAVFRVKTLLPAHTAPLSAWCSLPKSYTWRLNMAKTITLDTLHLQILRAGRLHIWYQRAVGSTLPSGTIRPTHLQVLKWVSQGHQDIPTTVFYSERITDVWLPQAIFPWDFCLNENLICFCVSALSPVWLWPRGQ